MPQTKPLIWITLMATVSTLLTSTMMKITKILTMNKMKYLTNTYPSYKMKW